MPEVPSETVTTPGCTLPVPIAPIMLSPPPAETTTFLPRPHSWQRAVAEQPGGAARGGERRQAGAQLGVDEIDERLAPFALAHVHQAGAGGVAVLHAAVAGEVEIEVIVREQDGLERLVMGRLLLLQPEDFRGGVAGEQRVAGELDQPLGAAEFRLEFLALPDGRGVAPELRRADDLVLFVERHEAVLLPADADREDFLLARAELAEDFGDGGADGVEPDLRVLLHVPRRQSLDEAVRLRGAGEGLAGLEVEREGFGALGAAVDAEGDHEDDKVTG